MQQKTILSIRGLTVEFRVPRGILTAVSSLDLDVHDGEVLGLVGESGCGKSVLAHTVLKLCDPNGYIKSGTVLFEGRDVFALGRKELRLAMIFITHDLASVAEISLFLHLA